MGDLEVFDDLLSSLGPLGAEASEASRDDARSGGSAFESPRRADGASETSDLQLGPCALCLKTHEDSQH